MKNIVQVVPPAYPAWSVWARKGDFFTQRVHLWALVEDTRPTTARDDDEDITHFVGNVPHTRDTELIGLSVCDMAEVCSCYDMNELARTNFLGYEEIDPAMWSNEKKQEWLSAAVKYEERSKQRTARVAAR